MANVRGEKYLFGYAKLGLIPNDSYTYIPFHQRSSYKLLADPSWGGDCASLANEHEEKTALLSQQQWGSFVFKETDSPLIGEHIATSPKYHVGTISAIKNRTEQFLDYGCEVSLQTSGALYEAQKAKRTQHNPEVSVESKREQQINDLIAFITDPNKYYHNGVIITHAIRNEQQRDVHTMDFIKRGNEIIFFDANYGQIHFKDIDAFKTWFKAEALNGVLQHVFLQGEQKLTDVFLSPDISVIKTKQLHFLSIKPKNKLLRHLSDDIYMFPAKQKNYIPKMFHKSAAPNAIGFKYPIEVETISFGKKIKKVEVKKFYITQPSPNDSQYAVHKAIVEKLQKGTLERGMSSLTQDERNYLATHLMRHPYYIQLHIPKQPAIMLQDIPPILNASHESTQTAEVVEENLELKFQLMLDIDQPKNNDNIYIKLSPDALRIVLSYKDKTAVISITELIAYLASDKGKQLGLTLEDFTKAIAENNQVELNQFLNWALDVLESRNIKHSIKTAITHSPSHTEHSVLGSVDSRKTQFDAIHQARLSVSLTEIDGKQFTVAAAHTNKHVLLYSGRMAALNDSQKKQIQQDFDAYVHATDSKLIANLEQTLNKKLELQLPLSPAATGALTATIPLSTVLLRPDESPVTSPLQSPNASRQERLGLSYTSVFSRDSRDRYSTSESDPISPLPSHPSKKK